MGRKLILTETQLLNTIRKIIKEQDKNGQKTIDCIMDTMIDAQQDISICHQADKKPDQKDLLSKCYTQLKSRLSGNRKHLDRLERCIASTGKRVGGSLGIRTTDDYK